MYATISADIVSSTSLSEVETIELKQHIEEQLKMLETLYPGFWGRLIKGDYIECVVPNACDAFRIALIIKNSIKAFKVNKTTDSKPFYTYGARIAIGIGSMRIVDREQGIMDGEAIYLSGRSIAKLGSLNKGALTIETANENLSRRLRVIAVLTDAILNDTTPKQSQVVYYKLLGYKESEIAEKMNIYQSGVNTHSSSAKWYCIEEALNYFEQIKFENYE
ncbi:MAG: RNA polymerase subunit sigma-70 [Bacteroidaceae bacterium]|nr:RNA polymerase subunit sigma-70 [Bacteroidaceae bacterium]